MDGTNSTMRLTTTAPRTLEALLTSLGNLRPEIMTLSLSKLLLAGLVATGVAGLGTAAWLTTRVGPEIDLFNCAAETLSPSHTVLLIDTTDHFSPQQGERLVEAAHAAALDAPRGGRVSIFLIRADAPWDPERALSICSPGRASEANLWIETPEEFEGQWEETFLRPLRVAAARLSNLPKSGESPILESVAALASRRDFAGGVSDRRLIYFGDGLQHSSGRYSHYAGGDAIAAYLVSDLHEELDPEFSGLLVELEYLRRPEAAHVQGGNHKVFWTWWFEEHGAAEVIIRG